MRQTPTSQEEILMQVAEMESARELVESYKRRGKPSAISVKMDFQRGNKSIPYKNERYIQFSECTSDYIDALCEKWESEDSNGRKYIPLPRNITIIDGVEILVDEVENATGLAELGLASLALPCKIQAPMYLGSAHWVGFTIDIDENKKVSIYHTNSGQKGQDKDWKEHSEAVRAERNRIEQMFRNCGYNEITSEVFMCAVQPDGVSCGPYLVENMYRSLHDGEGRFVSGDTFTAAQLREAQLPSLNANMIKSVSYNKLIYDEVLRHIEEVKRTRSVTNEEGIITSEWVLSKIEESVDFQNAIIKEYCGHDGVVMEQVIGNGESARIEFSDSRINSIKNQLEALVKYILAQQEGLKLLEQAEIKVASMAPQMASANTQELEIDKKDDIISDIAGGIGLQIAAGLNITDNTQAYRIISCINTAFVELSRDGKNILEAFNGNKIYNLYIGEGKTAPLLKLFHNNSAPNVEEVKKIINDECFSKKNTTKRSAEVSNHNTHTKRVKSEKSVHGRAMG